MKYTLPFVAFLPSSLDFMFALFCLAVFFSECYIPMFLEQKTVSLSLSSIQIYPQLYQRETMGKTHKNKVVGWKCNNW